MAGRTVTVLFRFADGVGQPALTFFRAMAAPSRDIVAFDIQGSAATESGDRAWESLSIEVRGTNFETAFFRVSSRDVGDGGVVDLVVQPANSLVLQLLDLGSRVPLADTGVVIRARPEDGRLTRDLEGRSDVAGLVVFPQVGVGSYDIRLVASDFCVEEPRVLEVARATKKVDVLVSHVGPGLTGIVVGRGKPVSGARVSVRQEVAATTDPEGRFEIAASYRRAAFDGPDIRFRVDPPGESGLSPARTCGPFAWGDRDVVIELQPASHVLLIEGLPQAASARCLLRTARTDLTRPPPEWTELPKLEERIFELPPGGDWTPVSFLQVVAEPGPGRLYCQISKIPAAVMGDRVVHTWVLAPEEERIVEVVDEAGAGVEAANVEVLLQVGTGQIANAVPVDDVDPSECNPLTHNLAQRIASGKTDVRGRCSVRLAAVPGTWLRITGRDIVKATHAVGPRDGDVIRVRATSAGSVRGVVERPMGRVFLAGGERRDYPNLRRDGPHWVAEQVPVGPCYVLMASAGKGRQPLCELARLEVRRGEQATFEADGADFRIHTIHVVCDDIAEHDVVSFVDERVGYPAATTEYRRDGGATASLTSGRYRVLVERRLVGSDSTKVQANEVLRVDGGTRQFAITLPASDAWQLVREGVPQERLWLRVRESEAVVRTDANGWLRWPVGVLGASVEAVERGPGSWRAVDGLWLLTRASAGQSVEPVR